MGEHFLPKRGNYRGLIVYQKAECIYDITYYFTSTYLKKGDRTIDQMVQAARSGKQNIAEGNQAQWQAEYSRRLCCFCNIVGN